MSHPNVLKPCQLFSGTAPQALKLSAMKRVTVKGRAKDYLTHPWIFSGKVVEDGGAAPGEAVLVYTTKGVFLGSAIYNPKSKIALRFYSRAKEELDYIAIKNRIYNAHLRRSRVIRKEKSYRIVFGESDDLPGLIIDRYGSGFSIQIISIGMEYRRGHIVDALVDLFNPEFIYEHSDSALRKEEGLPPRSELVHGELPDEVIIESAGMKYIVDIAGGQKTGFFFDQRNNRRIVEFYSRGASKGLDLFSYTGSFALHMLKGGVEIVYAVDRSASALELLKKNAELNGFERKRIVTFNKDAFDFLDEMALTSEKFDFIVLDPPSFTRKRSKVREALKAYRVLHEKAIALLNDGGFIATFSCAMYVGRDELLDSFYQAARKMRKNFYVLEHLHQAKDHPVLLGFPESEYLKGFLLVHKP